MSNDTWTPRPEYGKGHGSKITITGSDKGNTPLPANDTSPTDIEERIVDRRTLCGHDLITKDLWIPGHGITEFISANSRGRFVLSEELYSMHLLLLGGIGSGKTNVFHHIIRTIRDQMLYNSSDVMIIFDSKGDFYEKHRRPSDILIGNSVQYRENSYRWNIYSEIMGRSYHSYEKPQFDRDKARYLQDWELNARDLIKGLFQDRRSETQPFFADAAASIITKKIISVLRKGDLNEMHTYKLKEFFLNAKVEQYDQMILDPDNRDFHSAKQYYGDGSTPQALAVFAYINSLVDDLFCGVFGDISESGREFAMRELVGQKQGRVIFVEYDLRTGEVFRPIYQMLYDQALKEALGRTEKAGNVYLICDELKLMGRLEHIDDGLNFGRSLGVKVCAGIQSINQIFDIYGESRGKSILSGFSNMFCFRTGDAETVQFVQDHFGDRYESFVFWPQQQNPECVTREGHTVEKWNVLDLPRGTAIVDVWSKNPQPPFRFGFQDYSKTR